MRDGAIGRGRIATADEASGDLIELFRLKTAVLTLVRGQGALPRKADIARGFEDAIVDVLVAKTLAALDQTSYSRLVVGGGVARTASCRERLSAAAREAAAEVFYPHLHFCTATAR